MNLKPSRLNNMKLSFYRREPVYEAVMIDLYLMGAIPKDVVEKFTGRIVPDYLKPPDSTVPDVVEAPTEE